MRFWSSVLFGILLCLSCEQRHTAITNPYQLIIEDSDLVFQINDLNTFRAQDASNPTLSALLKPFVSQLPKRLEFLKPESELVLSLTTHTTEPTFSIVTKFSESLIAQDTIATITKDSLVGYTIFKRVQLKDTLYYGVIDSLFVGSNQRNIVKRALKGEQQRKLDHKKITADASGALAVVNSLPESIAPLLFLDTEAIPSFADDVSLDIDIQNEKTIYNGILKANDSLAVLHSFKGMVPQELAVSNIIPQLASEFRRIAYDDFNIFSKGLARTTKRTQDSMPSLLTLANEIASFKINNSHVLALHTLDDELLSQSLVLNEPQETFKGVSIYAFENSKLFSQQLQPFVSLKKANYLFTVENFAVFAEDIDILKTIISEKLNNSTLANSEAFKAAVSELSDESSFMIYKNKAKFSAVVPEATSNVNIVQYVYDSHYAHVHGILNTYKTPAKANSVSEHFSFSLPEDLIIAPQVMQQQRSKTDVILTQGVSNTLYCISNSGTIFWKRQLDGKILGNVAQVDSFKNGRLQLAFATQNRVYVLDKNGNDVGKFPLKFEDAITQPLSVFDYDRDKNYRLLVTQDNNLLMYDAKGKRVEGFKFEKAQDAITTQPKHFRINRKDYIVFTQGNTLRILNRKGRTRIPVSESFRFSNNSIYLYKNTFATTNTLGELIQVNTKGKVSKTSLSLLENHFLETTSKTLVALNDNRLHIRSKSLDLDYGDYTRPRIFFINDKLYISTTDKEAKKVYLFDSQTKAILNFPVFGTTEAVLDNIDRDKALELVTQTDSKTITVYKLN